MVTAITKGPAANRPSGRMYLSANQLNLIDDTWTVVELDAIDDGFEDGIEDTVNHWIKPGVAGWYIVMGQWQLLNDVQDKLYRAGIRTNGVKWECVATLSLSRSRPGVVRVSALIKLDANDYVQLYAMSGADVNTVDIQSGRFYTFLCLQRVR